MSKLSKVIFEYSDGSRKYIDQEELEKWSDFNFIVANHASLNNVNPPWEEIKWKKIGKDQKY